MKIIDLSHPFESGMPVFPGALEVSIEELSNVQDQGYHVKKIVFNSHTGTHIDSPFHMKAEGKALNELPVEQFFGKAFLLPLDKPKGYRIEKEDLMVHVSALKEADFVVFYTGWQKYWGTEEYTDGFPCLSAEAVSWLTTFSLKGIGLDTISVDPMDASFYVVHHTLFDNNMVIVENLTNLDKLDSGFFFFSALPLNITGGDGCPVRAVAIFPEGNNNSL